MQRNMSSNAKTIDNLGIQPYIQFEEDKKFFDSKLLDDSRQVAGQISKDIFEPILLSEYQILFDIGKQDTRWSSIPPPKKYHEQTKRLFMHQLAPKLGPEDFIDTLVDRLEGKREQEKEERQGSQKKSAFETENSIEEVDKECSKLIQLMQDINALNKMMQHINAERYRYNKG